MCDWEDAKGWTRTEFIMDFKSDAEARVLIHDLHDDIKRRDATEEVSNENYIFEKGEKIADLDLELAAEIGKALLEKNRELDLLFRSALESKEEYVLKSQFLENQVECLRETIEEQSKISEQYENHIFELNDKFMQLQIDYKTLNNKNNRFWDTIETLEKKCETYKCKIEFLEEEKNDLLRKQTVDEESLSSNEAASSDEDRRLSFSAILELEDKIENLQETNKDLRVQQGIDNIEKEELKAELEDVSTENQLLQHQVLLLENEVEEWKKVCEEAQKYKLLADKYEQSCSLKRTDNEKNANHKPLSSKSFSHEVLNETPLCQASDLFQTKQRYLSSSVSHIHQPSKNLSVLSEMDHQYHSLVQQYENLLKKYQHETLPGSSKRSEKVQRAIQTLSWDFSNLDMHFCQENDEEKCLPKSTSVSCKKDLDQDQHIDFRKLFVEIFAKLKESKDFQPENVK